VQLRISLNQRNEITRKKPAIFEIIPKTAKRQTVQEKIVILDSGREF